MQLQSVLKISASLLSLIVIGQSVAIIETSKRPPQIVMPDIFVGELEEVEEASTTATLWLEPQAMSESRSILTLWLENPTITDTVYAKLLYNPDDISIIDSQIAKEGTQIAVMPEADILMNSVASESGTIELLVKMPPLWTGKGIVATISAQKRTSNLTAIEFEYIPGSREGSYVSSGDVGDTVLKEPGTVTF